VCEFESLRCKLKNALKCMMTYTMIFENICISVLIHLGYTGCDFVQLWNLTFLAVRRDGGLISDKFEGEDSCEEKQEEKLSVNDRSLLFTDSNK
jgi:hypothetical protein